jgi:hypothetical protein
MHAHARLPARVLARTRRAGAQIAVNHAIQIEVRALLTQPAACWLCLLASSFRHAQPPSMLLTRAGGRFHARVQYSLMFAFHAMRSFCNKDRVALKGLAHYFQQEMQRTAECALFWSDYQTKRGGCTTLFPISKPEHSFEHAHGDALRVMEMKLSLERLKYTKLDRMHKARARLACRRAGVYRARAVLTRAACRRSQTAEDNKDVHFQDLIEMKMGEQLVRSSVHACTHVVVVTCSDVCCPAAACCTAQVVIKENADWCNQLCRVGKGHGTWDWDAKLHTAFKGKKSLLIPEE